MGEVGRWSLGYESRMEGEKEGGIVSDERGCGGRVWQEDPIKLSDELRSARWRSFQELRLTLQERSAAGVTVIQIR